MSDASLFASYLGRVRPTIDAYLAAHDAMPLADDAVAGDLNRYLYRPLARFTASGGKRTRPALALLGAAAVGADERVALPAAAAVELFQSAALVHDDIADEGELRRGEPCLYRTEGVGLATNVGDLGIVRTFELVMGAEDLTEGIRARLLAELALMERHTLEGQALDLGWVRDGRWDVGEEGYLHMARRKTAYYSAATPLAMGAIAGGGTDTQVEALRAFGMDAGLAFQLQDDLLNLVGDAAAQGKDFRSDVTEGKRTLAAVCALGQLEGKDRAELQGILASGTTDASLLGQAVDLMDRSGALDHVRRLAHDLADGAKGRLDGAGLDGRARAVLDSMADFFVERAG